MNTSPGSVAGMLGRLSTSVSNVSIRWAHSRPKQRKQPKKHLTGFKEGHGEEIFIYNHTENGMVVYSHDKELRRDSKRLLEQIPFTAKKLKPPNFRKDYWEPLCMIRFGKGRGEVGRNVFQKLREYRQMHELSWGWQAKDLIKMNKLQRGKTIHNQKRNAIADIAAVLAGEGRGNKMWMTEPQPQPQPEPTDEVEEPQSASEEATSEGEAVTETAAIEATPAVTATPTATGAAEVTTEKAAAPTKAEENKEGPQKRLLSATIYWANDSDLNWAREWTPNVDHQIGLPEDIHVPRWQTRYFYSETEPEPAPAPVIEEAKDEARKGEVKEGEAKEGEAKEGEAKEGEVTEGELKAEEKAEQPAEQPKPAKKGIFGSLFGRK